MTKLAIVFPGQGSQFLGMLSDLKSVYPEVTAHFSKAADILGYDLWKLTQEGPIDRLNQTEYTQPALLVASYAIWSILSHHINIQPDFLAGHSLGEYTALVCAGSLSFEDAIPLVAARGRFMQSAVKAGEGAMAAVLGLENSAVESICNKAMAEIGECVSPANYNSPGQIVIAGQQKAVERAISITKEKNGRAILLPVSVPSHCSLMQPAAEQLSLWLNQTEFKQPNMPVVNNVNATPYSSVEKIREGLKQQLTQSVRWVETIQFFRQAGVTRLVECGPGKVLTGLNKRIDKQLLLQSTSDLASLRELI